MKRKILFFVMILATTSLVTMQSCKDDVSAPPAEYIAAVPTAPTPAVEAVIPFTGANQTINLAWEGTASSAVKWDVYFGDSDAPKLVAAGVTANSYAAKIQKGGTYYWQVYTIDANGVESISDLWDFVVNSNPAAPVVAAPANNATNVSCNPTITWTAIDPEGDHLTYDLFLGTTAVPATVVATALADPTFAVTATLTPNTDYYWKVVANDPYGGKSTSAVYKFTSGALPVAKFVGAYNADEPAEDYSYDVSFTQVTASTIKTTNYWNSGWTATFTLDFDKLTFNMTSYTFSTGWTGVEWGIINKTTGTMTGTYTLWLNNVIQEQGVHTYTKK